MIKFKSTYLVNFVDINNIRQQYTIKLFIKTSLLYAD